MITKDTNLSCLTVIYRIKEVMNNLGFSSANYKVTESDPYLPSSSPVFPLILVEADPVVSQPFELGSDNVKQPLFLIDVYAENNHQRDDISDAILEDIDNATIPLYNFNVRFPTAIGNYSGIPIIGSIVFERGLARNLGPDMGQTSNFIQHHKLIMITGSLIKT